VLLPRGLRLWAVKYQPRVRKTSFILIVGIQCAIATSAKLEIPHYERTIVLFSKASVASIKFLEVSFIYYAQRTETRFKQYSIFCVHREMK